MSKRNSHHLDGRQPRVHRVPPIERRFDVDSGLVYSEVEVRFNRKQHSDWIGEAKTPALVKKPRPNEIGARSLADMAIIKVATQFRGLTPGHFESVPWDLAKKIWDELRSSYEYPALLE